MNQSSCPMLTERWREVADCVDSFEIQRQNGPVPLGEFVAPLSKESRYEALCELICSDLEYSWREGKRLYIEEYLSEFDHLRVTASTISELVRSEVETRRHFGDAVDEAEIRRRFPDQDLDFALIFGTRELSLDEVVTVNDAGRETSSASELEATAEHEATADTAELPNPFGRYRIVEKIGGGAMGSVYLARDPELQRKVAIKVPHGNLDQSDRLLGRFRREAQAAAKIRHPNVCPVYDFGKIAGRQYIAMAYIDGHSLAATLEKSVLHIRQSLELARKIADALHVSHEHGIVHRDVKPSNIIIDRDGEPVLADFGLARPTEQTDLLLTKPGNAVGTPAYMSPEQVDGDPDKIGPLTDVYSLGVVLYQSLTGTLPFNGTLSKVLIDIKTAEPEAPSHRRNGIPRRLDEIIAKALAKRVEDRFPSAKAFATAIDSYLKELESSAELAVDAPTELSAAARSPAGKTTTQNSRLGRGWIGLVGTAVVAVLVVGVLILHGRSRPSEERIPTLPGTDAIPVSSTVTAPAKSVVAPAGDPTPLPHALEVEVHLQRSNQQGGFSVASQGDMPLRDGDKVQFHVILPKQSYVYLFWYDANGKVQRLWPANPVQQRPHERLVYPVQPELDDGLATWETIGGDKGTEMLLAAYSESPVNAKQLSLFEQVSLFLPPLKSGILQFDKFSSRQRSLVGTVVSRKENPESFKQLLTSTFDDYVGMAFPHR